MKRSKRHTAKRKSSKRSLNIPKLPDALETLLAQERRKFNKFAAQMNRLPSLKKIDDDDRTDLLQELYRLADRKRRLESWTEDERKDSARLRTYRVGLVRAQRLLERAMENIVDTPSAYPKWNEFERLFAGEEARTAIIRAAEGVRKAIETVRSKQPELAALIHPSLRTRVESRLVRTELLAHTTLPMRERTRAFDLWFISAVASCLDKYQTKDGRRIPRYPDVIRSVFAVAFKDQMRTAESIRKELRRRRGQGVRELFF
jgi:hypothetical protein